MSEYTTEYVEETLRDAGLNVTAHDVRMPDWYPESTVWYWPNLSLKVTSPITDLPLWQIEAGDHNGFQAAGRSLQDAAKEAHDYFCRISLKSMLYLREMPHV